MSRKIQVVFLVETPSKKFLMQQRAICLACSRILLLLGKFPNREHPHHLQWSYRLFSPAAPIKSSLLRTAQFYELHSDPLMKFFEDLSESSKEEVSGGSRPTSWRQCVYNALAATVQDFIWDAPDIRTPVRRQKRRRLQQRGKTPREPSDESSCRNFIFLFSKDFSGGGGEEAEPRTGKSSPVGFAKRVLPKPLLSQLNQKSITVNWVYSVDLETDSSLQDALQSALQATGGMLMPISTFLEPVGPCEGWLSSLPAMPPASKVKERLDGSGTVEQSSEEQFLWLCSEGK